VKSIKPGALSAEEMESLANPKGWLYTTTVDKCAELLFDACAARDSFYLLSCQAATQMTATKQRQLTNWIKSVGNNYASYLLVPIHHVNHFLFCVGVYIGSVLANILVLDPMGAPSAQTRSVITTFFKKVELSVPGVDVEIQRQPEQIVLKVCHLYLLMFRHWFFSHFSMIQKCTDYAMQAPQQANDYDCGLYVITYIKHFMKDATTDGEVSFVSLHVLAVIIQYKDFNFRM
jgi:Ulp1 family protease